MDAHKNVCGDSIINIDTYNVASGDSIINSNFSEEKWISKMKSILNNEHKHDIENPICIFQVPKSVSIINQQAYTPQNIALGPYHQFQPKLYKMQKCKLEKIQFIHQQFNLPDFQVLFDQLKKKVRDVRGYYHEQLDIHDDTLSWIMIFDGMFLLRLIYNQKIKNTYWTIYMQDRRVARQRYMQFLHMQEEQEERVNENPLEFIDSSGKKISMDSILRDVVKLENQIPFFALEHLVARSNNPPSKLPSFLLFMTITFCPRISPTLLRGTFPMDRFKYPLHLLDLLYNLVWFGPRIEVERGAEQRSFDLWRDLRNMISTLNIDFLIIPVKIMDLVIKFFEVLGISISFQSAEEKAALIPTASQLSNVRVKFCLTSFGISSFNFIQKDATLLLPVLTLNVNSEVIIRNLLAYEAIAKPTRNFARFIELMAAMIHSIEDVELLRNKEVVRYQGDNSEVVKLFDGLRNPLIVSEGESELDGCIKEINEYYQTYWKIKLKKMMKKYVYNSWKILTILATILLLLLMTLQTFCSIYSCPHIFKASDKRLSFISGF